LAAAWWRGNEEQHARDDRVRLRRRAGSPCWVPDRARPRRLCPRLHAPAADQEKEDGERSGLTGARLSKTSDGQLVRGQALPLSKAALDLIKSLPGSEKAEPDDFVFPNRDGGAQDDWQRVSDRIQEVSETSDWTRHDIRRTGSTLLKELGVPVETIDAILNHTNPLANANVSGSAGHYLIATRILTEIEDPKAAALNKLAEAYTVILAQVGARAAAWSDGRTP
jgi:hypothetical protein